MTAARVTKVLCFAAHPDDLETYLGSTLLWLGNARVDLVFALATNGEAGTRQPTVGTRIDEQLRSIDWFTARTGTAPRLRRLGLTDGRLAVAEGLSAVLAAEIESSAADLVFAPHPDDPHPDHAALGRGVLDCVERVWHWLPAEPARVSHVLPVADADFEAKLDWIRQHASQIPGPRESRAYLPSGRDIVQRIRVRDARWGRSVGAGHAEPLLASDCLGRAEGGGAPVVLRGLEDLI